MGYFQKKLDSLTMYKVVIYGLLAISGAAFILSLANVLWVSPLDLLLSFFVIVTSSLLTHFICVYFSKAPANIESSLITALILFLIITPTHNLTGLGVAALISAGSIALKYIIRYHLRHIYNPAAIALWIAGLTGYFGADWWVGSRYLLPIVCIAGIAVVAKTRRWSLFYTYLAVSTIAAIVAFLDTTPALETLSRHFLSWPTVFFAAFMLTEPLGLPSTKRLQYIYASIAGILSGVPFSFGIFHSSPEFALVAANLFTFIVDRPGRLRLQFLRKKEVGKQTIEYTFMPDRALTYTPGQYLEWTLPHEDVDERGIRRYFTISSAPGEKELSFAVRHNEKQSTWKQELENITPNDTLYATQCAGDFVLRDAPHYIWIAGGIGITPFISMIRNAEKSNATIPATLFYCNKTKDDIAFLEEIANAKKHGVTVVHVLDTKTSDMDHEIGFITEDMIGKYIPKWNTAIIYISGSSGMVDAYKKLLQDMKVPHKQIVTDYFPGLA